MLDYIYRCCAVWLIYWIICLYRPRGPADPDDAIPLRLLTLMWELDMFTSDRHLFSFGNHLSL